VGLSDGWKETAYQTALEGEVRALMRRRERDGALTVEDLEAALSHFYIMEGADWGGRGEVQDLGLRATIAAYERVIAEWRGKASP
jgi:hypothetical protein